MAEPESKPHLQGHIALVTGATGGIGKAVSRLLASMGCSVCLHYNSDEATASQLLQELKSTYSEKHDSSFMICQADMGNYDSVSHLPTARFRVVRIWAC